MTERLRPTRHLILIATMLASLALALAAGVAKADAPYVPWPDLLPGAPTATNPQPPATPECATPSIKCVDTNEQRLESLTAQLGCDHRAVFSETYVLMTKTLADSLNSGRPHFADPGWIIDVDALFTDYYMRSFQAYQNGQPVPAAWRIAFDTAAHGDANATIDLLLGVNAHVNRDLPYVLAAEGLHTRSGASRKHDWDLVNHIINAAYSPIAETIAARYDASLKLSNPDTIVDGEGALQLFEAWREAAWRHAELLLNARTPAQKRAVEHEIETYAATQARAIAALPTVPGFRAARDAYCAAHNS